MFPAMPIYEFHCKKCNKDSERLVRSSDWKGEQCPHCGSAQLVKKLSVFSSSASPATGGAPSSSCCGMNPGGCGSGGCCMGGN